VALRLSLASAEFRSSLAAILEVRQFTAIRRYQQAVIRLQRAVELANGVNSSVGSKNNILPNFGWAMVAASELSAVPQQFDGNNA